MGCPFCAKNSAYRPGPDPKSKMFKIGLFDSSNIHFDIC